MLKTFAALIEFDGSRFRGWQVQNGVETVQQAVESAIGMVADESVRVHCAGRTDTGVHATGQVIHFQTHKERDLYSWLRGVNSNLPKSVSMPWIKQVDDEFHARFSAQSRQYRYIYYLRRISPAILKSYVTWEYRNLDVYRMQKAAQYLLGEQNFNAYRSVACQAKSPIRTIEYINIQQNREFVYFDIKANGFLHHMVRNIAGVLASIGCDEKSIFWAKEILESEDRRQGGVTAPPNGLYLTKVDYPEKYNIPEDVTLPSFW